MNILMPQKIVIGGGVAQQAQMLPLIRQKFQEIVNNYIQSSLVTRDIGNYIVLPGLGARAGVLGAFALAERALKAA